MFELSARAQDYVERTKQFIQNEIEPIETDFWHEVHELNQGGDWTKWQWPAQLETLKAKAKAAGLWICFCLVLNWAKVYQFKSMLILQNLQVGASLRRPCLTVMRLTAAIWKYYGVMALKLKSKSG